MNFRVGITGEGVVGTISCQFCGSAPEAQIFIFGGIGASVTCFEDQIRSFKYPIVVLSEISMHAPGRGHGAQVLRAFHHWAANRGAFFGFLRIGPQGDDYCQGVLRLRRFYKREGWVSLRRPQIPRLSLHWMYKSLNPVIDSGNEFDVTFEKETEIYPLFSHPKTISPEKCDYPPHTQ